MGMPSTQLASTSPALAARDRLIVGLDVPSIDAARAVVDDLGDEASFYKVGMQLQFAGGLSYCAELLDRGKRVFLDAKLHDIPNTVEKAVTNIVAMGVTMLTIHAYPQTMAAAVRGRAGSSLALLGVSVLTSMDDQDLHDAGYGCGAQELVRRRALQAQDAGLDGLICSPLEVARLRKIKGGDLKLITPGIRLKAKEDAIIADDQKRTLSPAEAIKAGADYIVVARPIVGAQNRVETARQIIRQIENAEDSPLT